MKADVYWDVRRRLYSVRVGGKVIAKASTVVLTQEDEPVRFVVQPGGRQRVLDTGRKNAFVRGQVALYAEAGTGRVSTYLKHLEPALNEMANVCARTSEVYYNPYNPFKHQSFVSPNGERVEQARVVQLFLCVTEAYPVVVAWGL